MKRSRKAFEKLGKTLFGIAMTTSSLSAIAAQGGSYYRGRRGSYSGGTYLVQNGFSHLNGLRINEDVLQQTQMEKISGFSMQKG